MTTAIERLEALLDQKDAENAQLRSEKAARDFGEEWGWMRQAVSEETEGLPVPRLEIRWTRENEWSWLAEYSLVYRFYLGEVIRQPFSVTLQRGGRGEPPIYEGRVDVPRRDGFHIRHDMKQLNLPAFAVCEGKVTKLEPLDTPAPYERATSGEVRS